MTATNKFLIAIIIAMLQPNCNLENLHNKIPNYNENVYLNLMSYMFDTVALSAKIAAISLIEI